MSYTIEFKAKDQMCLKRISLLKEEPTLVHEPRMVHAQILLPTISLHPRNIRQICKGVLSLHNWLYLLDPATQAFVPGQ